MSITIFKKVWSAVKCVLEPVSKFISDIVNFILLALVYFIGVGLVSISMKLFGKHFLEIKRQNKKSNWNEHKVAKQPLENYYRTF